MLGSSRLEGHNRSLIAGSTESGLQNLNSSALLSSGVLPELDDQLPRIKNFFSASASSSAITPLTSLDPGNTLGTARNIGSLCGTNTFSDAVSSSDTSDFYRFSLGSTSNFNLSLTSLSTVSPNDADVLLIRDTNNNRIVDAGEKLARSALNVGQLEAINRSSMAAGTYFIQVHRFNGTARQARYS